MSLNFNNKNYQNELNLLEGKKKYYDIKSLANANKVDLNKIPFSIRILIENVLRSYDKNISNETQLEQVLMWNKDTVPDKEFPYMPGRVVLQDFTGVPVVVDLAAMRDAVSDLDIEPSIINPIVRSDLVIDHSVQVDSFAQNDSLNMNISREFERNQERYKLLKWAQNAFSNFLVVPPGTGIVHQVNLENLAEVILASNDDDNIYPDTCVGTDSHTTMINAVGVLGWGVGGIEAEAVMLGQPYYMQVPEVVGVKLFGDINEGTTATDIVLAIVEKLREVGVVEKFVEFFGPGLSQLSLTDRATISNMAPEYGATCGFFPVDDRTIDYLKMTGRDEKIIDRVVNYTQSNGLFYDGVDPEFSLVVDFDLSTVESSLAGPKRPQDRLLLSDVKENFYQNFDLSENQINNDKLDNASVVIAAITSCTNTSNPNVMVGAGLIARNAFEKGMFPKEWVKTSLAPGSKVVSKYLEASGLNKYLDQIGFQTVGYGCTTCIGNSGPLPSEIAQKVDDDELSVSAVLSGNRNFEGRVHPQVKANYLASPMLVVLYALAGTVNIDFSNDPIGNDKEGKAVYLEDLWPSSKEIEDTINNSLTSEMFIDEYESVFQGPEEWVKLSSSKGNKFNWEKQSTYIQKPPYFDDFNLQPSKKNEVNQARCLVKLSNSVTTDHISPAGSIPQSAPSGQMLISSDVPRFEFNSYGSRRGNHNVMVRGTFGNIRLRNQIVEEEGDWTVYFPTGEKMRIFEASEKYLQSETPLIVLAGKEYGTGSSRDWAAKGPALLGVKVVIAESFERIHRSNLVGMGVIPLQFIEGENSDSLNLNGSEIYDFEGLEKTIVPNSKIKVNVTRENGEKFSFYTMIRIDTEIEAEYYYNGGLLPYVLRKMVKESS
ncbi:MAG: aconitate hydratase 1 [Chloroflexi bacterium TMED70]|nr:MAG: aconitate hydratase 1 [Chloroflexi bacterium TMED70]